MRPNNIIIIIVIQIQCLQNFLKINIFYPQFINVSSLSIALGLSTASDTLSSQVSYSRGILKNGGGGMYHKAGMAGGLIRDEIYDNIPVG